MQTFLEKTAQYLVESYSESLGEICVVLPNRRAGLFLKRNLANIIEKPVWAPEVLSVEDFVFNLTGYQKIEQVYLFFELFEIYRDSKKYSGESFDEFVSWAGVILKDFNDVDLYLADPDQVFNYLNDVKAMSLWNPDGSKLTAFQLNYLRFFNSLADLYKHLTERLLNSGQVYQGLAYRKLSDSLSRNETTIKWKHIVFAGFNALTPAENRIITHLQNTGIATLLWDADRYYLDNPDQEAGTFLRKIHRNQSDSAFKWLSNDLKEQSKNINLIGVPLKIGQVKTAGNILSAFIRESKNLDSTAIILNDESLLFPLMNSLPEPLEDFNVTMGLPLKSTTLYVLVDSMLTLHENSYKIARAGAKGRPFYFADVLSIIEHPWMRDWIVSEATGDTEDLDPVGIIQNSNKAFLSPDEIKDLLSIGEDPSSGFFHDVFSAWNNNAKVATTAIRNVLVQLKDHFIKRKNEEKGEFKFELEYLFHFTMVFNKLDDILSVTDFLSGLTSLRFIFNTIVQSVTVPFYGEPLRGIQIMGMLESRTLDFENIIMLSVNEDFIPAGKTTHSFIPFEVRKTFNLPVEYDHNAVYAYHFYRLLQRANDVYLIYNTQAGKLGGGEKSRFIAQLQYELPSFNPKIKITDRILSLSVPETEAEPVISIEKTPDVVERLDQLALSGFSASSLNVYRNCSLQFYFTYVLNIREMEGVEETIEAATLGKVIHGALQDLYKNLEDKRLTAAKVEDMKKEVPGTIEKSFFINYPEGEIRFGKNLLAVKVAESYLMNFLDKEISFIQSMDVKGIHVFAGEMEKEVKLAYTLADGREILLKGFIDRTDRVGDTLRIIDYKTGKVEQKDLKPDSWDVFFETADFDKAFQLMLYTYIFQKLFPENSRSIQSGIISFRNLGAGFLPAIYPDEKEWPRAFENVLNKLLREIYDLTIPFAKTDDPDHCRYCSFKNICRR